MKSSSLITLSLVAIISMAFFACSGENEETTPNSTPSVQTGIFIDAAVAGISYETATQSGITDANGHYNYLEGEDVVFSIGSISLPSTLARIVVTPLTIAVTESTSNPTAVNISRLLQTLDSDGNSSNGIQISESTRNSADSAIVFEQEVTAFEVEAIVILGDINANLVLVSEVDAIAHLNETLSTITSFVDSSLKGYYKINLQDHDAIYNFNSDHTVSIDWNDQGPLSEGTWEIKENKLLIRGSNFFDTLTLTDGIQEFGTLSVDITREGENPQTLVASIEKYTPSLLGSWIYSEGANKRNILSFMDESHYIILHEHGGGSGEEQTAGSGEYGTYSWNSETNTINIQIIDETDGDGGFTSIPRTSLKFSHDKLVIAGNNFEKVQDNNNVLVGGWIRGRVNGVLVDSDGDGIQGSDVLTFISDNEYAIIHTSDTASERASDLANNTDAHVNGEFGTYTRNAANDEFSVTAVSVNKDEETGLSDLDNNVLLTVSNSSITFVDGGERYYFDKLD